MAIGGKRDPRLWRCGIERCGRCRTSPASKRKHNGMNVLICTSQVPFITGGAEVHVENLMRALIAAGHEADVVALPFKWYPPQEIVRSTLAWRMLDVTEANGKPVDMVIGMKFPAYLVEHPR